VTIVGRVAIAAGVVLVCAVGLGMCARVADRGRFAVPGSTYGGGPQGARGLYLLAERQGLGPVRWADSAATLPDGAMLVALGGCASSAARPVARLERESLERWVEAGGTLVVAGAHDFLWSELGVTLEPPAECARGGLFGAVLDGDEDEKGKPSTPDESSHELGRFDPLGLTEPSNGAPFAEDGGEDGGDSVRHALSMGVLEGLGTVPLRAPGRIVVADKVARTEVFLDLGDRPAGVILPKGSGAIVVLASASPFENRGLVDAGGAAVFSRLVAQLTPAGPVLFDEYHLGVGQKRSMMAYFRELGAVPLVAQLALVVLLLLWRLGARFGSTQRPRRDHPAGTASYVNAIGTLYRRSADGSAALGRIVRHALAEVAQHHRAATPDAGALAEELERRKRPEQARAVRDLAALGDVAIRSPKDLVARGREVDDALARAMQDPPRR
jgi:hypothetical protein